MITLHILQLLEDNSLGTIGTDLFWEDMPLDKNGVAIYSRGGTLFRGRNKAIQAFDLYSRGTSAPQAADRLEKIWEYFVDNYVVCDLPIVENVSEKLYRKARFTPIANVENLGKDETDRLLFRLSMEVVYIK